MAVVINISSVYSSPASARPETTVPPLRQPARFAIAGDTVEFSRVGRALSNGVEESSFRIARVRAIRAEIESGTYETAAGIEGTVERLLDVVG